MILCRHRAETTLDHRRERPLQRDDGPLELDQFPLELVDPGDPAVDMLANTLRLDRVDVLLDPVGHAR